MTSKHYENILSAAGLRPSPVRLLVARTLAEAKAPMSGQQIETELDTVDRSSITRALASFAAYGLVHSIDDGSGSVKYELCHDSDAHGHDRHTDSDRHPHFHCEKCGATFCLSASPMPKLPLPDGFVAHSTDMIVKGLCPACYVKK